METVHQLRERFAEALDEMDVLTASNMTDEDVRQFNQLDVELTQLKPKIETAERRSEMITRSTARESGDSRGPYVNRLGDPFDGDTIRLDASVADLRARIETGLERDGVTPDDVKESTSRTLVTVHGDRRALAVRCLATGSAAYRSAFAKVMSGNHTAWTEVERQAVARAQSLTDAAGGFAVPFTLDPSIIGIDGLSINPLRRIARVVRTTSDSWNGVTGTAAAFSWDTEGTEVSDDSITLVQPAIPVHKMQGFIPFSVEVGGDWAAIDSDLRTAMMEGRDNLEATAHLTGTGTNQPTGIQTALDGTASEIAPITAETFTAADVHNLQRQLPPRHRMMNPTWVMNIGTAGDIRQFDTGGGGNFWTSLGNGTPEVLLGWPWAEASLVDDSPDIDAAATADNFILFVGNWSRFVIVDRVGMSVELIPHLFGNNNRPTGQRGLYAWLRTGSDSVDDNGFRVLSIPTTA